MTLKEIKYWFYSSTAITLPFLLITPLQYIVKQVPLAKIFLLPLMPGAFIAMLTKWIYLPHLFFIVITILYLIVLIKEKHSWKEYLHFLILLVINVTGLFFMNTELTINPFIQ